MALLLALSPAAVALLPALSPAAVAQTLPPFRDREFRLPPVVSEAFGGAYRVLADDPRRDPARRDARGGRVGPPAPSLGVRRVQREVPSGDGVPAHVATGRTDGARVVVVYLHGTGGNRLQGVDDYGAAGNFNRLKNLVARADGLYLTPDVAEFGPDGAAPVAALIAAYAARSPGAPVVVACGSAGGAVCYALAADPPPGLAGLLLLGTYADDAFPASAAVAAGIPALIAHGADDPIFPVERAEALFRSLQALPGYRVAMLRFDRGNHGSPIRLLDWREAVNWILAR